MGLVLTITNAERLDNGVPTRLELDRHGAVIGRSPTADWSLPDETRVISSTHCEIDYRGGAYLVIDKSTNGTFLNGGQVKTAPSALADGDTLAIGHYQIGVRLKGAGAAPTPAAVDPGADIWGHHGGQTPIAPKTEDWLKPAPRPVIQGGGALGGAYAPPPVTAPAAAANSGQDVWGVAPAAAAQPHSPWSSDPAGPPPVAQDIWGQFASVNSVDWARGGFGAETPRETPPWETTPATADAAFAPLNTPSHTPSPSADAGADIFGLSPPPVAARAPAAPPTPAERVQPPRAEASTPPHPAPATAPSGDAALASLLSAAGLAPADARGTPDQTLAAAGSLLRRMTAGLVVMLEARARAKQQLGAAGTIPGSNNNPLKFARAPERALAQLLNAPERSFMPADEAIEDAFRDLQAHQMATLVAMQGALAATLARFSPQSIRDRAETGGLLASIMPNAKSAALWKAYEKEFEGVARGSDEAFMDVFAKEFRTAYERAAEDMRNRR